MKMIYNRPYFIVCCLLFLLHNAVYGADISGRLVNLKSQAFNGYYYNNIDGFCNMLYSPSKINFNNNSFHISLKNKNAGFCIIQLPKTRVSVYVSPTDTLHFNLYYPVNADKASYKIDSVIFYGSNSFGNNLYNQYEREILWKQAFYTSNIFLRRSHGNVQSLFKDVSFVLDSLLAPFVEAYQRSLIGKVYYLNIKADITATVLLSTTNLLDMMTASAKYNLSHIKKDTSLQEAAKLNSCLLTDASIDSLKRLFYNTYSPSDSSFLNSWLGVNYVQEYYQNHDGTFKNNTLYDSNFNKLTADNRYLGFMRGRTQEIAWGRNLHWYIEDEQNFPAVKREYNMFRQYYPASELLKFLHEKITGREKEWKESQNDMPVVSSGTIHLLTPNNDSTLTQIAKRYFFGKNVFIDLWASWCHPCLEELAFKNELQAYLNLKGVETLYLSIDNKTDEETWKNMINRKQLTGYHILSSDELQSNMKRDIYRSDIISIPRYILINKQGKIIDDDLPRPSDMSNLKNKINKLIP